MSKFDLLDLCLYLMKSLGESFSTSVTLFVSGLIISGDLIHPIAYYKGVAETLEAAPSDPETEKMAKFIAKSFRESVERIASTSTQTDEECSTEEPDMIYLDNVTLWNPPNSMVLDKSFIALRIDSIDGFVWGRSS